MSAVVWHDVECGGYTADLPLWEELASEAAGGILDLGCGTGRVALRLAKRGHSVTGLDLDAELVTAFNERASGSAQAVAGDARDFELEHGFGLALAPMQLLQLLDGAEERVACLRCVAAHLAGGGRAALAIVESMPEVAEDAHPLPDTREVDGWVYSSLPLGARRDAGAIAVSRLRQTVSPAGELSEEVDEVRLLLLSADDLEAEAETAGLRQAGRQAIDATDDHVGSTVVLLEKEA
ncbi:MAG TPA: class I SAM-dependent methyltransferase [Solirubrobacterales bacterium]|nr:class I SAM-dependent methyltransferase [Solirubrobacterales bacterium]